MQITSAERVRSLQQWRTQQAGLMSLSLMQQGTTFELLFAFRFFLRFVSLCFVFVLFLVYWSSGWLLPCASDRRLARCMSPFLCLVVVLVFCLLVSALSLSCLDGTPVSEMLLLGPVTLLPPLVLCVHLILSCSGAPSCSKDCSHGIRKDVLLRYGRYFYSMGE